MSQSSRTPAEWIALAKQGKAAWNEQVALLADSDIIDFRNAGFPMLSPSSFAGFKFPVKVNFARAQFNHKMDFSHAVFESDAVFTDAEFYDKVTFHGAKFNGDAFFDWETEFRSRSKGISTFPKNVIFDDCLFSKVASFRGTQFGKDASFKRTQFKDDAQFRNAKFKTGVYFDNAKFKGYAVFHGVVFSGAAYFEGATFDWAPLFKGEDMHGNIRFNPPSGFDKQFLDKGKKVRVTPNGEKKNHAIANYRELKLAMKRIESHAEENAFFRLEMLARKHKEPWPRKGLYWLYELASDYGQSIYLPAMWLGVFFLAFLWFYHLSPQFIGLCEGYDGYVNALHLALKGAFVLPGMFAGGSLEKIQLSGFGIVLAGVHWLLSAASWFLMLLGFRNRFRLK